MKAIVLAAGKGERLEPLTLSRPKHMINVGGKPVLEWLLKAVRGAGIVDVLIVTSYKEDYIKRYFGDGSRLGLHLSYITQKTAVGTAAAIDEGREYVGEQAFLALYGDLLVSEAAIKSIAVDTAPETSRMVVVPVDNPALYGVVEVEKGEVTKIVEKQRAGDEAGNWPMPEYTI